MAKPSKGRRSPPSGSGSSSRSRSLSGSDSRSSSRSRSKSVSRSRSRSKSISSSSSRSGSSRSRSPPTQRKRFVFHSSSHFSFWYSFVVSVRGSVRRIRYLMLRSSVDYAFSFCRHWLDFVVVIRSHIMEIVFKRSLYIGIIFSCVLQSD